MATEAPVSPAQPAKEHPLAAMFTPPPVMATTYAFPSLEPIRFVEYPHNHLMMPLRKDLLHRAVVYEGDMTRQGTASTKWRGEVHGSNRKLYPQKGLGRARAGNSKSPVRVGGGVAFGPHPRDFSTKLNRKIYDKAWRIALSYRYSRGELTIVDEDISVPQQATPHLVRQIMEKNEWHRKGSGGITLITEREDEKLFSMVRDAGQKMKILSRRDVDVKDLLETGRLVIEKRALDKILATHSKDLNQRVAVARY